MDAIKLNAIEIISIIKNIYQIQENNNPNVIFKNKFFLLGTEENPEEILIERNYENNDSSYYFETSKIEGVIIKRENGNYCVKGCVSYKSNNINLYFAKIRIEEKNDEDIHIMGKWGGSWQHPDYEDEDQIKNPNSDFPIALESMKKHLTSIYYSICNNELNKDLYNPEWVKKLRLTIND